jgi:tRNA A-37 threonylcarbamoyl transferase component Bud32
MEEETGVVSKVMLEDFAEQEYQIFCAFADAGLAARPMGFQGPKVVPGGSLYTIQMERIHHTLEGVLHERQRKGPRQGLNPINEASARRIGEAIVRALQGMWDNGLVHGDLHLANCVVNNPQLQPMVQLLDFGRSARNTKASQSADSGALRAGHEYDVFRLCEETINDFEEMKEETTDTLKECKKEIAQLKQECQAASMLSQWAPKMQEMLHQGKCKDDPENEFQSQLHDARQIAGLQAYIAEEPEALEKLEAAYDIILKTVVQYASAKLDLQFDGAPSLSNRKMRQAIAKRQRLGFNGYFKSHLFWGS